MCICILFVGGDGMYIWMLEKKCLLLILFKIINFEKLLIIGLSNFERCEIICNLILKIGVVDCRLVIKYFLEFLRCDRLR